MTRMSPCTSTPGLVKPTCHTPLTAVLDSWTRFIRLRQARHVYFDLTKQTDDQGGPSKDDSPSQLGSRLT